MTDDLKDSKLDTVNISVLLYLVIKLLLLVNLSIFFLITFPWEKKRNYDKEIQTELDETTSILQLQLKLFNAFYIPNSRDKKVVMFPYDPTNWKSHMLQQRTGTNAY